MLDISVIIPLYNEEESLPELSTWIERVMNENKFSYEIIFVNDGSRDNSWKVVKSLSEKNTNIKGISFSRNYGKSAALHVGFKDANGNTLERTDANNRKHRGEEIKISKFIKFYYIIFNQNGLIYWRWRS